MIVGWVPDLQRGRRSFARADWRVAYDALGAADLVTPLDAMDLELFGRAAYMLDRDDDYVGDGDASLLDRALAAYRRKNLDDLRRLFRWAG